MKQSCLLVGIPFIAIIVFSPQPTTFAQDDEVIQLVVGFLADADKDIRALAFEQVRSEVSGESATKKFAELLPGLPPETQAGLLVALSDRGDKAAAPAVRDLLAKSDKEEVRVAAIKALGTLGQAADLATLIEFFSEGTPTEQAAARRSLVVLPGNEASEAMASELDSATTPVRVMLMETLTTRRARNTIPAILDAALDDNPNVRRAAMVAEAGIK